MTVTVSVSIPASIISSAFCGRSKPFVLMHFIMAGNSSRTLRKVSSAKSVASVSPGPATPTTFKSGESATARRIASIASSGLIMPLATPGRFSVSLKSRLQKRQPMLQPGLTGKWTRPLLDFCPSAKQGCSFAISSNVLAIKQPPLFYGERDFVNASRRFVNFKSARQHVGRRRLPDFCHEQSRAIF